VSEVRAKTLAHLNKLVAAAAVLGVGSLAEACKKPPPPASKDEPLGDDASPSASASASASASSSASASASASASLPDDAGFVAPSTSDTAAFRGDAGPGAVKPKPKPPPTYHVVDPIPHPTRVPKGKCETPFTIDANGVKHYKPECL